MAKYPAWEVRWEEWIYVNERNPDSPRWTRQREIAESKRDAKGLADYISRGQDSRFLSLARRIRIRPLDYAGAGESIRCKLHHCRKCGRVHLGEHRCAGPAPVTRFANPCGRDTSSSAMAVPQAGQTSTTGD